jgi:hypothetical protein
MLPMEEVRRVMGPEGMGNIREQTLGCSTGRLHPLAVETRKGWRHQRIPRVVIPCCCGVLQHHGVALGGPSPPRHRPPVNVSSSGSVLS